MFTTHSACHVLGVRHLFLLICIVIGLASGVLGETILVPSQVGTIQLAIDNAQNGDTILVAPGSYNEALTIVGKSIALLSSEGALSTILTAQADQNILTLIGEETSGSTIEGFSLSGGRIGILCQNSGPIIRRNLLVGQNITNWGAISLGGYDYATVGPSPAVIENNTIVGCANGGISTFSSEAPTIQNNIIAFNAHYGIHREGSGLVSQPVLAYNDIYGNPVAYQEIAAPGIGSIALPPMFQSGYLLLQLSPCIDAGNPGPEFNDPDGSRNDMGAIPFDGSVIRPARTIRIPVDFSTIQEAIENAINGDTLQVGSGIYAEQLDFYGKALLLVSQYGPSRTAIGIPRSIPWPQAVDKLRDPGSPDETAAPAPRDFESGPDEAILNSVFPSVIRMVGGESATVRGFTIDGGEMIRGLYAEGNDPVIEDCVFQNCVGGYDGGATYFQFSAPTVVGNTFRYNVTPISGGGVFVRLGVGVGEAVISDNVFHDNVSGNGPAIALIEGDLARVERNLVYHNTATSGSQRRGAIYFHADNISATNNTLFGNTVGITVLSSEDGDVRNNILDFNLYVGLEFLDDVGPNVNVSHDYNVFWSNAVNYAGTDLGLNELEADPLFEPSRPNEFLLGATSPCRDGGDPDPVYNDPDGSRNDIGARPYEEITPYIPTTFYVPGDFGTIQAAIDAALYLDTILVLPGIYQGTVNYKGKNVIVRSVNGPLETTITGSPSTDLVVFSSGETRLAVLEGFTLAGGRIGVLCQNASPTIRRNVLAGQTVTNWGAISLGGGSYATTGVSPALIENNTIVNCSNGGISTFSVVAPVIRNNIIAFNAHYGIHREGGSGIVAQPELSYNDVYGNPMTFQEILDPGIGAIFSDPQFGPDYRLIDISPCIDAGDPNPALNDPDGSRNDMGALPYDGLVAPPTDTVYVPDDFADVQAAIDAVGNRSTIFVRPGLYVGPIVVSGKSVSIVSTDGPLQTVLTAGPDEDVVTFYGSTSSQSVLNGFEIRGGRIGIWCRDAGPLLQRNILFGQNVDDWAAISLGGVAFATAGNSPAVIENNTIVNSANGGISTFSQIAPTIRNNVIAFNGHYGIHREGIQSIVPQPILYYNDVYGNPTAFQNVSGPGFGSITEDPLLGPGQILFANSPCIDAGDPDVQYNDPDGTRNDMGAVPFDSTLLPELMDTVYVPTDFATLSEAFGFVKNGGVILLEPGVHTGGVTIRGKSVSITSTGGPLETTVTGEGGVNLITIEGTAASGSIIKGLTLSGGNIGIWCKESGPTIRGNILTGQGIPNWAAISLSGLGYGVIGPSPATIVNNTIVNAVNGAISTFSSQAPTIKNNIMAFNGHYGIHREGSPSVAQPELSYNDFFGNPENYQEIADTGLGTISADPLFDDGYALTAASPCIDAGDPAPEFNDPDGSRNDMGALPFGGAVSPAVSENDLPGTFAVKQNFPNPFNPTTVIEFSLPRAGTWSVEVYSILGRRVYMERGVASGAGAIRVQFDGSDLASGVYLYRVVAGSFTDSRKMLLLK